MYTTLTLLFPNFVNCISKLFTCANLTALSVFKLSAQLKWNWNKTVSKLFENGF